MTVDEKVQGLISITKVAQLDSRIAQTARNVIINFGAINDYDKAQALFNYVRNKIRFSRDPLGMEIVYFPMDTLAREEADCEDYTITLGALFGSLGFPVAFKAVNTLGFFNHIYPLVGIPAKNPQRWIALDATVAAPMGTEPKNILEYRIYKIQ